MGIITVTGPSGVGKTSIVKKLLELRPEAKLVVSLTSRPPRDSDLQGEYRCNVGLEEFEEQSSFIWVVEAHGNHYGTLMRSVNAALHGSEPSLMILVPQAVSMLRKYSGESGNVSSFYILPPPEAELRARLKLRGEDEPTIEKRISDCRQWGAEAWNSEIPYAFIFNNDRTIGIEIAAKEILKHTR